MTFGFVRSIALSIFILIFHSGKFQREQLVMCKKHSAIAKIGLNESLASMASRTHWPVSASLQDIFDTKPDGEMDRSAQFPSFSRIMNSMHSLHHHHQNAFSAEIGEKKPKLSCMNREHKCNRWRLIA